MNLNRPRHTWHIMDRALELGPETIIMGVINVTPDSFSDGGLFRKAHAAIEQGIRLWNEGAKILDVGGESTRPGSDPTPLSEELARVIPVIEGLAKETDALISIDTMKAEVAERALAAGAGIINDISALRADPAMPALAARSGAGLILMHMQGMPKTMQVEPHYDDLLGEVAEFLKTQAQVAMEAGVAAGSVVIDPGIGFGKTFDQNLSLIKELSSFWKLDMPVLLGASRKAFIGHYTGKVEPAERLWGTLGVHVAGALTGAHIVRVHDVAPLKDALVMADAIRRA